MFVKAHWYLIIETFTAKIAMGENKYLYIRGILLEGFN